MKNSETSSRPRPPPSKRVFIHDYAGHSLTGHAHIVVVLIIFPCIPNFIGVDLDRTAMEARVTATSEH